MGKINESIKVVASSLNTCHGLLGICCIAAASYAIHSTYRSVTSWLSYVVALGLLLFLASLAGCAGMHRQIVRRGRCTGRCILSFYQLAMTGILVLLLVSLLSMRSLASGLAEIVEAPSSSSSGADEELPYSRMEQTTLAPFFDQFYFKAHEVYKKGEGGYGWFVAWVGNNCPSAMSLVHCDPCANVNPSSPSYVPAACCPNEEHCAEGEMDACPYMRCRKGVAIYLGAQLSLFQRYAHVILALQLFILLNTCLLICYNPRDSLAELLEKTGVLIHHPPPDASQNRRWSRRRASPRFSPRQEHGGVASPTAYRSESPSTYPLYNGRAATRRGGASSPPVTAVPVAVAVDDHPHSMV